MSKKSPAQHLPFSLRRAQQEPSLVARVIPSRARTQDAKTLKAAMHSLVLDQHRPIALELAGTSHGRGLLIRATSRPALQHVAEQLRAHEPQTKIVPLEAQEDPFHLAPHERLSVIELVPGAAAYLPLQSWESEDAAAPDPVLGLLASLGNLPEGTRAIAQIALIPAKPTWSRTNMRKGIEHALEPERQRKERELSFSRAQAGSNTPSTASILGLALIAGLFLLYQRLKPTLPTWFNQELFALLHGHLPALQGTQGLLFWGSLVSMLLLCMILFILVDQLRRLFLQEKTQIYDMNLVSQKTLHVAYQARLRLYVIAPGPAVPSRPKRRFPWQWQGTWRSLLRQPPWATWKQLGRDLGHLWSTLREQSLLTTVQQIALDTADASRHAQAQQRAEWACARERLDLLSSLIAAYRQFHLAGGGYFVPQRVRPARALLGQGWHRGLQHSKHFIDLDALTNMWHLPHPSVLGDLPLMEHRRARTLLPSPSFLMETQGGRRIGYSEHAGYKYPVCWPEIFLRQHTQVTGKSGEGKSTCMEQIALEIMHRGEGLVFLTPHGDTIQHLLNLVPQGREDVVYIDLADAQYSIGLNPLDVSSGRSYSKAVSDMLKTIAKIWVTSFGPRMEIAAEVSMKTLAAHNRFLCDQDRQQGPQRQHTLLDVLTVLTNESFCHALLQDIEDPFIHRWWRQYYEPLSLVMQRERIDPVLTKLAKFESEVARRILGQSRSTVDFSRLIADRAIVLINLGKGVIGDDAAKLLGATFLSLIQVSMEEQGLLNEADRRNLGICVDEYQFLAGVDYQALAELRKFGATFFLGTQSVDYLEQLDPMLLPTIRNNIRQYIAFHTSAKDAEFLANELGVEPEDLLGLDPHMCYVKLRNHPTFSMMIEPAVLTPKPDQVARIMSVSRRYSRPAALIDEELKESLARGIGLSPRPRAVERKPPSPVAVPGGESPLPGPPPSGRYRGRKSEAERRKAYNEAQRGGITPMDFSEEDLTAMGILGFAQDQDESADAT